MKSRFRKYGVFILWAYNLITITALSVAFEEDVQLVKQSLLMRKELTKRTRGFIYDLKTGEVKPVSG